MIDQDCSYKQYGTDEIKKGVVKLTPGLIGELNKWKESVRVVFENLLSLTDSGMYGILITATDLSKVSSISPPSIHLAVKFLMLEGLITKSKHIGTGSPNVYFINVEKLKEVSSKEI